MNKNSFASQVRCGLSVEQSEAAESVNGALVVVEDSGGLELRRPRRELPVRRQSVPRRRRRRRRRRRGREERLVGEADVAVEGRAENRLQGLR